MIWAWIGALLIGISLGLLGSGGSILTVPVLIYLVGEPEKVAIAESLGIVAAISLVGAIPYAIRKEVDWKSVFYFGIPGMAGTYGGAALSAYLSGSIQLMIFAVVMLLAAAMMIRKPKELNTKETTAPIWMLISEGLVVGVITGLVGVGGGFLIIPALVGFYKYIDVLAKEDLSINWQLVLVFTLIGILGSFIGSKASQFIPQQQLKRGFGYFLILMGVYILYVNFT
jgi:uncharacterized membrane protein YfcA